MRLTRGKIVIIPIFVAVAASLGGLYYWSCCVEPTGIDPNITVTLESVRMKKIDVENPDVMIVHVDFAVFNNTTQTLAMAKIDYDMHANDSLIGRGNLSLEDIPLTGRAPLFPNSSTTLPSEMQLRKSPEVLWIWDKLSSDNTGDVTWRADGVAHIETAFSILEKNFSTTL